VVTAIHDAIALANLIYALPSSSNEEVGAIFEQYQKERHFYVTNAFKFAQLFKKMIAVGVVGAIAFQLGTRMPKWLWKMLVIHDSCSLSYFLIFSSLHGSRFTKIIITLHNRLLVH
jgi:hypothetical protein